MSLIKALLTDDPAEREAYIDRETLRMAVASEIFCRKTGRVLDFRTAVYVVARMPGQPSGAMVLDGAAYDEIAEGLAKIAEAKGATLEIIDGRAL